MYSVVAAHVLPVLCTMLGASGGSLRQDAALQIRAAMVALPAHVFPDLAPLLAPQLEQDFFFNVMHVQSSRQVRALNQLQQFLASAAGPQPAATSAI